MSQQETDIDSLWNADIDESEVVDALPKEFIDAHHHFLDTTHNTFQHGLLASLNGNGAVYLPENYYKDVVQPLREAGVELVASVHVECLPNNGGQEAAWVESLRCKENSRCTVKGIVASCDLASPNVAEELKQLHGTCRSVKGIRWILDYAGPYNHDDPDCATHVAATRHQPGMEDYLRGGPNGGAIPAFEQGFALLEQYCYSFDLQCAPEQLAAAAALFAEYPNIPVVIDHLAKPRKVCRMPYKQLVGGKDGHDDCAIVDQNELQMWRQGIHAMASLPNVFIKISMLGYAVPDWISGNKQQRETIVELVQKTVDAFGAARCMVALNWWKDAATSDSDGLGTVGPTPVEYIQFLAKECFAKYSASDRFMLFAGTAKRFYKLE